MKKIIIKGIDERIRMVLVIFKKELIKPFRSLSFKDIMASLIFFKPAVRALRKVV